VTMERAVAYGFTCDLCKMVTDFYDAHTAVEARRAAKADGWTMGPGADRCPTCSVAAP